MTWKNVIARLQHWGYICGGCLLYAAAVNLFLDDNGIAAGGLAGIATVLTRVLPIRMSILLVIMELPLVALAWAVKGWDFVRNTIAGFLIYTVLVELTSYLPVLTNDPLLACLCGGAAYGAGMALMTLGNSSIGGTELIVRILASRFPSVGIDGFCILVDGSVVLFAMVVFRNIESGIYAILTILICSRLVNRIVNRLIWGFRHGSLCMIITSNPPKLVSEMLIQQLGISVTKVDSVGMYANSTRSILLAAVHESETPKVKAILDDANVDHFMVMIPISELKGGRLG